MDIFLDGFEDGTVLLQQSAVDAATAAVQRQGMGIGRAEIWPLHGGSRTVGEASDGLSAGKDLVV